MINRACSCFVMDRETGEEFCTICNKSDFDCSGCGITEVEKNIWNKVNDQYADRLQEELKRNELKNENERLKNEVANLKYKIEQLENQLEKQEKNIGDFAVKNSRFVKWREN